MMYELKQRPMRIWLVAWWNIACVFYLFGVLFLGYFLLDIDIKIILFSSWVDILIGIILVVASLLVVFDRFQSPFLMMIIAIVFNLARIWSSVLYGIEMGQGLVSWSVLSSIVWHLIYIGLNFWVMYGWTSQECFKSVDRYFRS